VTGEGGSEGPAWVAVLRAEMRELRAAITRDIHDTGEAMAAVEARATRADRFVRRVIYAAAGTLVASIVTGAVLLYQAGEKVGTARAEAKASRQELVFRIEGVERSLTELRIQANVLLTERIRGGVLLP
jgi:hypothetical protein